MYMVVKDRDRTAKVFLTLFKKVTLFVFNTKYLVKMRKKAFRRLLLHCTVVLLKGLGYQHSLLGTYIIIIDTLVTTVSKAA